MRFGYIDNNGKVCIIHAVPKENIERDLGRSLTDQEYREFVLSKSLPPGKVATEIIGELPDRSLRDKWRIDGGRVRCD